MAGHSGAILGGMGRMPDVTLVLIQTKIPNGDVVNIRDYKGVFHAMSPTGILRICFKLR